MTAQCKAITYSIRAFRASFAPGGHCDPTKNGLQLPCQERMRLKKLAERKKKKIKEKAITGNATLNVGSMTGRRMKVVAVMEERKIEILCVLKNK